MDTTTSPDLTATRADRDRLVARLALPSAVGGLALGVLHALARYRTADGASDLDLVTTRFWAEPADRALAPLLDWAGPDVVYLTYGKLWLPVFVVFTLAALVAYRVRRPRGFEKGVWRVVLVAYAGACASVAGEYWTQWGSEPNALLDAAFLVSIPFVLLTILGSTVLGATMLARRYRPRATAILLTLAVPGLVVIPMFVSLGSIALPIAFAWALAARHAVLR